MSALRLSVRGIAFWASGLPGWDEARAFLADGSLPESAPRKPAPDLLAPNERRRAPDTVALALQVAQAACTAAGADPKTLPSIFTSTHGDLAITDYMCSTLAADPRAISPTRFHNSVHNAAAGYWTIGTGCMQPATAISAYDASFAQGLLDAAAQLASGESEVLLVAYDAESIGPLAAVSRSEGLLAGALVLGVDSGDGSSGADSVDVSRAVNVEGFGAGRGTQARLILELQPGSAAPADDPLSQRYAGNAMAPMLTLFALLAGDGAGECTLPASRGQRLRIERVA
jgi:hypothetical protein